MQTRFARWAAPPFVALLLIANCVSPAWAKGPFVVGLVLSPDGTRLYLADQVLQGDGHLITTLRRLDTASLQVVATAQPHGNSSLSSLAVSADGSQLYLGRDGGVDVVDALTYQPLAAVQAGPDPLSLAASSDGRRLYVANADWGRPGPDHPVQPDGGLTVIDTTRHQVITTLDVGRVSVFAAVSPDDRRVCVITYNGPTPTGPAGNTLKLVDAAALQVVAALPLRGLAHAATMSPDGKRLYLTIYDSSPARAQVTAFDTSSGQIAGAVTIPNLQYIFTAPPVVSPDGKRLYLPMGGGPASVRILDTAAMKFTGSLTLPGGAAFLAISPDGKRLYAVDPPGDTITVIDTDSLQTKAVIKLDAATTVRN